MCEHHKKEDEIISFLSLVKLLPLLNVCSMADRMGQKIRFETRHLIETQAENGIGLGLVFNAIKR